MTDLEEAIELARHAIQFTPMDNPGRAGWLTNLGLCLRDRSLRTGVMSHLEEATNTARQAVEATPVDHPDQAGKLGNLSTILCDRYLRNGELTDLEEAINLAFRALQLNNIGICLRNRYLRTGAMTNLEEAISLGHRAVYLSNLSLHLDLETAINIGRQAVEATPSNHLDRAAQLHNVGTHLFNRYSRTGAMTDLDEAINLGRQAIQVTPSDPPDRAGWLTNLGIYLNNRYSRTGAMADLEEAISLGRQAVEATPSNHPDRTVHLSNLSRHLGERYSRTGAMSDLETAINIGRQAVEATPKDHPDRAIRLNNLGICLGRRYSRTGAMADLEEAIEIEQQAVEATPSDHPSEALYLDNLGNHLHNRYSRAGTMSDLETAINIGRQAVEATPKDHPDRAKRLNNLGVRLGDRYLRTCAIADLQDTQKSFTLALRHSNAIIRDRVSAGRNLISSPEILHNPQEAYSISKATINLIPLLPSRSLQHRDKRHLLSTAAGLACDAAAISLHAGKAPVNAVQFLETGRGIIADAFYERSEISILRAKHPELASSLLDHSTVAPDSNGSQRQEAMPKFHEVLKKIRSHQGFDRFFLPTSEADLLAAAMSGPIAVINVSSYRCDALLLQRDSVRLLELPRLSWEILHEKAANIPSFGILGWLWDTIVKPILNSLGFTTPPTDSRWPHIWWVPTGILAQFPLHAAGHHLRRSGETALDRVVSSYSSSVKAIQNLHQQESQALVPTTPSNAVIVAMQHTPKQGTLRFASVEANTISDICQKIGLAPLKPQPYKSDILSALEHCRVFHFAGHSNTHPAEPLHSQLFLDNWETQPLTVESLLELNLRSKPPFLAYLSACGTGQVIDETSIDESIHLTSAYQLAGFRHVIGTLWSVDDELSVDMARMTYELLRDTGGTDESVSQGLHHATRQLRDRWIQAEIGSEETELRDLKLERDVELEDMEVGRSQAYWIPYVHYGI
ncbi:hypothetical protein BDW72DRAFT_212734 [Aspergillus terricola var. indicus]